MHCKALSIILSVLVCVRIGGGVGGREGGSGVGSRSHSCFTDDLTLQMQALNLLENKIIC